MIILDKKCFVVLSSNKRVVLLVIILRDGSFSGTIFSEIRINIIDHAPFAFSPLKTFFLTKKFRKKIFSFGKRPAILAVDFDSAMGTSALKIKLEVLNSEFNVGAPEKKLPCRNNNQSAKIQRTQGP